MGPQTLLARQRSYWGKPCPEVTCVLECCNQCWWRREHHIRQPAFELRWWQIRKQLFPKPFFFAWPEQSGVQTNAMPNDTCEVGASKYYASILCVKSLLRMLKYNLELPSVCRYPGQMGSTAPTTHCGWDTTALVPCAGIPPLIRG